VALFHVQPHGSGAVHRPHDVHIEHQTEVRQVGFREGPVPQDAGIVDEDIHLAPAVDGFAHHRLDLIQRLNTGMAAERLAARSHDFIADVACCRTVEVIHHNPRSAARQRQGMCPAQSSAGSGNDRNTIGE